MEKEVIIAAMLFAGILIWSLGYAICWYMSDSGYTSFKTVENKTKAKLYENKYLPQLDNKDRA